MSGLSKQDRKTMWRKEESRRSATKRRAMLKESMQVATLKQRLMKWLKTLAAPKPILAKPLAPFSEGNLAFYRDVESGISFAYPNGWVSGRVPNGAFVMHRHNPEQLASGIVDLGMTLMQFTFKNSPYGQLDDKSLCAAYVDNVTMQGRPKTLLWRTTGTTATGFPTTTFCYHYDSGGDRMSAVAHVAAAYGVIHHLDVTGVCTLVDGHIESWKALLHRLNVEKMFV